LGERLLCKQEVVGSIPSASRVGWLSSQKGFGVQAARGAPPLLGGAWLVWSVGDVFFMDCESGSGASLDAQGVSVGLGGAVSGLRRGGLDR